MLKEQGNQGKEIIGYDIKEEMMEVVDFNLGLDGHVRLE